jgi:hypothetical protein
MGQVIRFASRPERERMRLIREARAMYDSIFPSTVSVTEQSERAPGGHAPNPVNDHYNNGGRS